MNAAPVRSVYSKQHHPCPALEAAPVEGSGDCSVILSFQNISTETQAPSRLAVLRRDFVVGRPVAGQWHRAYRPSLFTALFGTSATRCPGGGRMLAPLFVAVAADPRANAKQEGIP